MSPVACTTTSPPSTWQNYHLDLAFEVTFTISAPENEGMNDWFICAQILKQDIAEGNGSAHQKTGTGPSRTGKQNWLDQ
jgi:hypothetical protein